MRTGLNARALVLVLAAQIVRDHDRIPLPNPFDVSSEVSSWITFGIVHAGIGFPVTRRFDIVPAISRSFEMSGSGNGGLIVQIDVAITLGPG